MSDPELSKLSSIILGQVITSRTETVEDYFKDRCHKVVTIGMAGLRQQVGGRCTLYEKGRLVRNLRFYGITVKGESAFHLPLVLFYYIWQSVLILILALHQRTRFHFAIGISTFYAFVSVLLKRLGFVNQVVYYRIDYYPSDSFMNMIFRKLDNFCIINSCVVWNLSGAISRTGGIESQANRHSPTELIVPLTYRSTLLSLYAIDQIERWSIAFVGTLERLQGLELLVKAMPLILEKLPGVIVHIVGDGPYANELMTIVQESGFGEHFIFHGFVRSESEMIEIVSRCAIGVAPYVPSLDNNAMTADPGKPKLYAFLGLPVVITKIPSGLGIANSGAGIAINYDPQDLANAVVRLLKDDKTLIRYRENANSFARNFTSEEVFQNAIRPLLQKLDQ